MRFMRLVLVRREARDGQGGAAYRFRVPPLRVARGKQSMHGGGCARVRPRRGPHAVENGGGAGFRLHRVGRALQGSGNHRLFSPGLDFVRW